MDPSRNIASINFGDFAFFSSSTPNFQEKPLRKISVRSGHGESWHSFGNSNALAKFQKPISGGKWEKDQKFWRESKLELIGRRGPHPAGKREYRTQPPYQRRDHANEKLKDRRRATIASSVTSPIKEDARVRRTEWIQIWCSPFAQWTISIQISFCFSMQLFDSDYSLGSSDNHGRY